MGMVAPMVKVPHEECDSALTTTMPRPARATMMIKKVATMAVNPATGPTSVLAISASDLPLRRVEKARMMKSCTPPATTEPMRIHNMPGR